MIGGVAVFGANVVDTTEHVTSMWVGAALSRDGSAAINEEIDYNFAANSKHGIFRDVPRLNPASPIGVSSPDAPDNLEIVETPQDSSSYPATRLRIGDPGVTVSGKRRYLIKYTLNDLAPGGALAWDAIGAGWDVSVEQAEIQVAAPWVLTDLRCVQGGTGSTAACEVTQPEPGLLVVHPGKLDAHQGVTVYASAGAPLEVSPSLTGPAIAPNSNQGAGVHKGAGVPLTALVGAGAALLGAGTASRVVRRRGRERVSVGGTADPANDASRAGGTDERLIDTDELASLTSIESAPPDELTPPQGGVLLQEAVREEHKVAWLIDEAIDGSINLVDQGTGAVALGRGDGPGDPLAASVLDTMFAGRNFLMLGTYDKPFAAGWSMVGSQLKQWADSSGLWDPKGARRRIAVLIGGGIAAVVGVVAMGVAAARAANSSPWWGPLIAVAILAMVAGAGLACAVRAWELRVRTPAGTDQWLRVESFRRFLAQSERHDAEQAAARGVLGKYTAWAVAVGEVDRWSRAVNAAGDIPVRDIPGRSVRNYVHLAPILHSATSATSAAPSSSRGGGGVGGGGGGGGGGSW